MNIDELLKAQIESQNRSEWTGDFGGSEVTFYTRPLCPADYDVLKRRGYGDFLSNPTAGGMVEMLLHKVENEAGNKVFRPNAHRPMLNKVGANKIGELFGALFGSDLDSEDEEQFEERLGNSEAT